MHEWEPGKILFSRNISFNCLKVIETLAPGMRFSQVIGQRYIIEQLTGMVLQNRLSHALLFLGKEGSGALPLALSFSTYLTSYTAGKQHSGSLFGAEPVSEPGDSAPLTGEPAGKEALLADQLIHPDIHFSYPVIPRKPGDKPVSTDYVAEWREFVKLYPYGNVYDWLQFIGAENKQGNITAAECADIIRKLNLKSFESEYKILILWMPEYLDKEGNKLLKLIEEPPPNTLFILVAENESLILPTIVSRCQLIRIPLPEISEIETALVQRAGVSQEQARQVASVCEGNYREALQLLQHAEEDWQSLLRDWLNAILKTGPAAQVKWVEEISKQGREKQKQFLRYFNHLLEQSIHLRVITSSSQQSNSGQVIPQGLSVHAQELDFVLRLNKISTLSQQQAMIQELDQATYYIERNANAKMLFQALTIKLYHIIQDNSLILTT